MDGNQFLDEIFTSIGADFDTAPDRSQYIPYIWSKTSINFPNSWDDFSYESTAKVIDFKDAVPHLELSDKLKDERWHVLKITGNLLQTADKYIEKNTTTCQSFSKELQTYYRSIPKDDLIQALSSKNMGGVLLLEARNVLKEKGVTHTDQEIIGIKTQFAQQKQANLNKKRTLKVADLLIILIVLIILFIVATS